MEYENLEDREKRKREKRQRAEWKREVNLN